MSGAAEMRAAAIWQCEQAMPATQDMADTRICDVLSEVADKIRAIPVKPDSARELLASWMLSHGYATGHGDSVEGLLGELEGQFDERIDRYRKLLGAVELRAVADEAELTRLREENIELRNSHAAVVQEAYERLSDQRADIARKDEALSGLYIAVRKICERSVFAATEKASALGRQDYREFMADEYRQLDEAVQAVTDAIRDRENPSPTIKPPRKQFNPLDAGFSLKNSEEDDDAVRAALHPLAPGSKGDAS